MDGMTCRDPQQLAEAVVALAMADGPILLGEVKAFRVPGPLRLSEMFMQYWTGRNDPSEELAAWLKDRGLMIVPGGDHHGGWEVREGEGGLF